MKFAVVYRAFGVVSHPSLDIVPKIQLLKIYNIFHIASFSLPHFGLELAKGQVMVSGSPLARGLRPITCSAPKLVAQGVRVFARVRWGMWCQPAAFFAARCWSPPPLPPRVLLRKGH